MSLFHIFEKGNTSTSAMMAMTSSAKNTPRRFLAATHAGLHHDVQQRAERDGEVGDGQVQRVVLPPLVEEVDLMGM